MSDIPQDPNPASGTPETEIERPGRPAEYVADISFEDMKLSEPLRRAITERGYTHPTPVQAKAFQPVMEGRDLIVRSKTGTGKTAAFGLPLLEKISPEDKHVRALILCPTRELALQVADELRALGQHKGIKVAAIYGGASMKQQEDALEEGTPIIVGTPGRVFDHINRGNLKLDGCDHAVLDEADEMLNQGFYEEVTRILDRLPKNRQVLLFSATVPTDIQNLIARAGIVFGVAIELVRDESERNPVGAIELAQYLEQRATKSRMPRRVRRKWRREVRPGQVARRRT